MSIQHSVEKHFMKSRPLPHSETFRPIPILAPTTFSRKLLWNLRLIADFQQATVYRDLIPWLKGLSNARLLDVGCGDMPYRHLVVDPTVEYLGCDIEEAESAFGYRNPRVIRFGGVELPTGAETLDRVMCTEVLEHHPEPHLLVDSIWRSLKPGGKMFVTVPWSARVHFSPYDFRRYTPYELRRLFHQFSSYEISARGTDHTVICNKLIVIFLRSVRDVLKLKPSAWLGFALLLPLLPLILFWGQLSMRFEIGSESDPLGFTVIAVK